MALKSAGGNENDCCDNVQELRKETSTKQKRLWNTFYKDEYVEASYTYMFFVGKPTAMRPSGWVPTAMQSKGYQGFEPPLPVRTRDSLW